MLELFPLTADEGNKTKVSAQFEPVKPGLQEQPKALQIPFGPQLHVVLPRLNEFCTSLHFCTKFESGEVTIASLTTLSKADNTACLALSNPKGVILRSEAQLFRWKVCSASLKILDISFTGN